MPKQHNHKDSNIDAEFDNVYREMVRFIVSATTPNSPTARMIWFNPDTGKLRIFKNTQSGWELIN